MSETKELSLEDVLSGREKLYEPVEVAYILKLATSTITRLCRKGGIQAIKMGGVWRIQGTEVLRYLREGPIKNA